MWNPGKNNELEGGGKAKQTSLKVSKVSIVSCISNEKANSNLLLEKDPNRYGLRSRRAIQIHSIIIIAKSEPSKLIEAAHNPESHRPFLQFENSKHDVQTQPEGRNSEQRESDEQAEVKQVLRARAAEGSACVDQTGTYLGRDYRDEEGGEGIDKAVWIAVEE